MAIQKKAIKKPLQRVKQDPEFRGPDPWKQPVEEPAEEVATVVEPEEPAPVPHQERTIAMSAIGAGWNAYYNGGEKTTIAAWLVREVSADGRTEVVPGVFLKGTVVPARSIPGFSHVTDPTGKRHDL